MSKDKKRRKLKKAQKRIKKELGLTWRLEVLKRDGNECAICGKKEGRLHVHHILPKHFVETRYDVKNGIVLCFVHHVMQKFSVHQNGLFFYEWLKKNRPDIYEYLLKKLIKFVGEAKQ